MPGQTKEKHLHGAEAPPSADEAVTLFREYKDPTTSDFRRQEIKSVLAAEFAPIARRVARGYENRGEPMDDLTQVAMMGLLKAIDGYDPERGKRFLSYLRPMVAGELKRYFRDHTWAVKVPRRHQENRTNLNRVVVEYQQKYGREPTSVEISRSLRMANGEVAELMSAASAYSALSLDAPYRDGSRRERLLSDTIGESDARLDRVVDSTALKVALTRLSDSQRELLHLRFVEEFSQQKIGEKLGYSQMHVSRLLHQTLERLRRLMAD